MNRKRTKQPPSQDGGFKSGAESTDTGHKDPFMIPS